MELDFFILHPVSELWPFECHLVICRGRFELPKAPFENFCALGFSCKPRNLFLSFSFWAIVPNDSNFFDG